VVSFAMTDLTALTLMGQLASGSAARHPWPVPFSTWASALTSCMPCSFGLLPHPRSGAGAQPTGLRELTVVVRWIPLVTAAYGTRVARPARTTTLPPGGDGPSSAGG